MRIILSQSMQSLLLLLLFLLFLFFFLIIQIEGDSLLLNIYYLLFEKK